MTLLKTKYTWGGKSPASGLDCSGLVAHVYKQVTGLDLTGTAAQQYKQGRHVAKRDLKEGDLVFFNTLGRPKSHVGIYIGEGNFVHALNRRVGVRVDSLDDSYYARRFEGARTLLN
ncbi:C40 family peptidase [Comamonas thiooxydans]|uniref:C40 family peptidase n=1 Tax=Comamonas thiooxydans TaxID=363952 RepID=UPI001185888A|nr:C40 family peptidase [Comamonas thiooxydans]